MMTDAQLNALGDQFIKELPKRFPSLVIDAQVQNVIVGFVNRCQAAQADFTLEHMFTCIEKNAALLTWQGTVIADVQKAEQEKAANRLRQMLRESLGLVHHNTELDRVSQSERTGQGSGEKTLSNAEIAKKATQEQANNRLLAEIQSEVDHGCYHRNHAEMARRRTTLEAIQKSNISPAEKLAKIKDTVAKFKD
jgi:hypothetical protein